MTAINSSTQTFIGQNSLRLVTASVVTLTSIACIIIGTLGLSGVISCIGTGSNIRLIGGGLALFIGQLIYLVKTTMSAPQLTIQDAWSYALTLKRKEFFVHNDPSDQKNKITFLDYEESMTPSEYFGWPSIGNYLEIKCFYTEVSVETLRKRLLSDGDSHQSL